MLPLLLFNVISSLVVDKATDLATEHVESMIDDLLPSSAKKELDKAIKEDPAHQFTTAKEASKKHSHLHLILLLVQLILNKLRKEYHGNQDTIL